MKQIIREYKEAILVSLSAVLILALCIHGGKQSEETDGLWNRLSDASAIGESGCRIYEEPSVYQGVVNRRKPTIRFVGENIRAGRKINVGTLFSAEDEDGNILETFVEKIEDTKVSGETYSFPKSGFYEVVVCAEDSYGKQARESFRIPVQRRNVE